MNRKLGGLAGVLGHITGDREMKDQQPTKKPKEPVEDKQPTTAEKEGNVEQTLAPAIAEPLPDQPQRSRYARHGRMPGRKRNPQEPKAKASVYITAELLEQYRAWSWQLRCQLGDLMAQALQEYQERHRKGRKSA